MNKIAVILFVLILFGQNIDAQTYYYQFTKSIIKGKSDTNVSGGQFITFDGKKCFESDKYGNNVGNGTMSYDSEVSTQTGLETFWGNCYWSKNGYMTFNADRSLMNIETNTGKIYVYKRATAPANVTTCSLIRETEQSNGGGDGGGVVIVQQPYQQGGYGGSGTFNNGGNGGYSDNSRRTGGTTSRTERDKPQKTRHTCSFCNGTGKWERNDGSIPLYGGTNYKVRCNVCGYEHYRSTNHRHVTCPQCHGRGYKEY